MSLGLLLLGFGAILVASIFTDYFFVALLGVNTFASGLISDLISSILLSLIYYPNGQRKNAFRDPSFHRQVVIYFILFSIFTTLRFFILRY